MLIKKDALSNGVRLITATVAGVESCTVQVFVNAGSRHENSKTHGLAHFLEHMVFKGTEKYPTSQAISSAADGVGAEINASTSKERTSFYLKVTQKHIPLAFDLLSEMVLRPNLDRQEIEKEKGVIVSEIQMYEDLPPHKAYNAFEEVLFAGTELEHDVAGEIGAVREMGEVDFRKFREEFYKPERMVVSVAGKFAEGEVKELAEDYFGGGPAAGFPPRKPIKGTLRGGPPPRVTPINRLKLVTKPTEQAHIFLGFPGSKIGSADRYAEAVLAAILGGGMSSRFFLEVREKRGLAYYVNSVLENYTDTGYFAVRMGVNPKKVEEAIAVILEQYHGISNFQFPISNEELEKSKEFTKGRFILGLEDTENVSDFIGEDELLERKARTPEEVVAGVDMVAEEDLLKVAKRLFDPRNLRLAVVGPYKDASQFEKLVKNT